MNEWMRELKFITYYQQKNEKLPTAEFESKKTQEIRRLTMLKVNLFNSALSKKPVHSFLLNFIVITAYGMESLYDIFRAVMKVGS